MECTVIEGETSDVVEFSRAGVDGRLIVEADAFDLSARLGFLLGVFRGRIEAEIEENLDAVLAEAAAPKKKVAAGKVAAKKKQRSRRPRARRYFSDSTRSTYSCIASSFDLPASALQASHLARPTMSPKPGCVPCGVAARGLLVERVELKQRHVVGLLGQALRVCDGLLELRLEIGHGSSFALPPDLSQHRDRVASAGGDRARGRAASAVV